MDFDYTASEQSFREEVRSFISENLPPKKERDKNFLANWLEKVRAKGWVGFAWPKEFGGSEGGLLGRGHPGQSLQEGHGGLDHLPAFGQDGTCMVDPVRRVHQVTKQVCRQGERSLGGLSVACSFKAKRTLHSAPLR